MFNHMTLGGRKEYDGHVFFEAGPRLKPRTPEPIREAAGMTLVHRSILVTKFRGKGKDVARINRGVGSPFAGKAIDFPRSIARFLLAWSAV